MSLRKTDVDYVLQTYIRNNVNGAIAPGHIEGWYRPGASGGQEGSLNMNYVAYMEDYPAEAVPSSNIMANDPVVRGYLVRQAINALTRYYAGIGRGNYGLIYQWCLGWNGGYGTVINTGSGYFAFNDNAPGVAAKRQNVINQIENRSVYPEFQGKIVNLAELQNEAARAWSLIYNSINNVTVDMVVCHSNCHNCCHGARGRR